MIAPDTTAVREMLADAMRDAIHGYVRDKPNLYGDTELYDLDKLAGTVMAWFQIHAVELAESGSIYAPSNGFEMLFEQQEQIGELEAIREHQRALLWKYVERVKELEACVKAFRAGVKALEAGVISERVAATIADTVACHEMMRVNGLLPEERVALFRRIDELEAELTAAQATAEPFYKHQPDEDGWSEWVNPAPGYLMACCDCGLVHEMDTAVMRQTGPIENGQCEAEDVDDPDLFVTFRMRRHAQQPGSSPEDDGGGE